ncbi:MAG: hypothetical protein GXW99_02315, partial [Clostridiales bacterium]|nr:hypothetical protein [Clostridiales bacterium]
NLTVLHGALAMFNLFDSQYMKKPIFWPSHDTYYPSRSNLQRKYQILLLIYPFLFQ